jgi:hypothetical protein
MENELSALEEVLLTFQQKSSLAVVFVSII